MKSLSLLGLVLATFATASACDEPAELFHDCPLSQTLLTACAENSDDAEITCAVKQHPMCEQDVCAKWQGSDSFCSKLCTQPSDCPTGSSCEPYLDYAFCVPDDIASGTVTP